MNTLVEPQPRTAPPGLLLHCGAKQVGREEIFATQTPRGTDTWYPLPHQDPVLEVESQLRDVGFTVEAEGHGLSKDGARYFGVLAVSLSDREPGDYRWVVGLRNSHDKSFPAGLVAGTQGLCGSLSCCLHPPSPDPIFFTSSFLVVFDRGRNSWSPIKCTAP